MKKHIPNLITLLNLLSGLFAVIYALDGDLIMAAFYIVLGILFDFFDGFAARILNVSGELGKQLDSLADMVTSGVAPAMILLKLIEKSTEGNSEFLPIIGLLFALAAAYRLANFNIDTRQTSSFIGLPTPAATLVVISLPLILHLDSNYNTIVNLINNPYVLIGITITLSILMNAEIPLFSLKFKNFTLKDNKIVYLFLAISVLLLVLLQFIAIPLIIFLYVAISLLPIIKKNRN